MKIKQKMLETMVRTTTGISAPEDLDGRVSATIKENQALQEYLQAGAGYGDQLAYLAEKVDAAYAEFGDLYRTATAIDIGDAAISIGEGAAAIASGGAADLLSTITAEAIESLPKYAFIGFGSWRFHDWRMAATLGLAEAASFIPLLGDIIDILPLYRWQVGKQIRKHAADRFLEMYGPGDYYG